MHKLPAPPDTTLEIVWLHGWGQTGASLQPLAGLYAAQAQNLVPDLPGFGQTPMLAPGAGSADYAAALHHFFEAVKPAKRRRIIVGHSFGARIAVQYAARYPRSVDAIILIAGAGLKRRRTIWFRLRARLLRMIGKLARLTDRLIKSRLQDRFRNRFGSADYRNAGPLRDTLVSVVNEDLSEQARNITVPVLLIYGEDDDATPPELGERYKTLMAQAVLHRLQGFGHLDILSRGKWQCQSLIDRFLERFHP